MYSKRRIKREERPTERKERLLPLGRGKKELNEK